MICQNFHGILCVKTDKNSRVFKQKSMKIAIRKAVLSMKSLHFTHTEPVICVGGFSPEKLKQTADAGFSFVEVGFSQLATFTEEQMDEYLAVLAQNHLTPVAANGFFGIDLGTFFDGHFDMGKTRDYIARAFERTRKIHFESISFGSGYMRRIPDGYDRERAKEFFVGLLSEEVVPMLEKYDARLNIEELQASETNFINTCREAADIAKAVGHPRVGVLCDFYHMTMGGETAADVPEFAKQVGHVHLASPTSSRSIPYETDGDDSAYRAFLKALAENGFDGRFSAEGGVAGDRDFAAALKECYTYMKALLMPYEGKKA